MFFVLANCHWDFAQHIFELHVPNVKSFSGIVPGLRGRWRKEGLEYEGEDLRDSRAMKSVLIALDHIQIRHAHVVEDRGGIVWNIEKDEDLSRTDVSILHALADHVGEELGNDSGGERPRSPC